MGFHEAWKARYGDGKASEQIVKAQRVYADFVSKGHDMSGLVRFVEEAPDKSKRDLVGLMVSYVRDLPGIEDPAPRSPRVATPPLPPAPPPAKAALPAPPRAGGEPGFDEAWSAWPKNLEYPENIDRARGAWEAAVLSHGASSVTRIVKLLAENERSAPHPRHFSTVCRDVLPAMAAAEPTESDRKAAIIDMTLMPKGSMDGIDQEEAIASWKRIIQPRDRVSFRLACVAYAREKKRMAREMGDAMVMSWDSFLSRWRSVDVRKVGKDAMAPVLLKTTKGMPFAEGLRDTVEVQVPKIYAEWHREWETRFCDPACDPDGTNGCSRCGRFEPIADAYDVPKLLADAYAWAAALVEPYVDTSVAPDRDAEFLAWAAAVIR